MTEVIEFNRKIDELLDGASRRCGSFPELATQFFTQDVEELIDSYPDHKDMIAKLAEATGEYCPGAEGEWVYDPEEGDIEYYASTTYTYPIGRCRLAKNLV